MRQQSLVLGRDSGGAYPHLDEAGGKESKKKETRLVISQRDDRQTSHLITCWTFTCLAGERRSWGRGDGDRDRSICRVIRSAYSQSIRTVGPQLVWTVDASPGPSSTPFDPQPVQKVSACFTLAVELLQLHRERGG